MKLNMTSLVPSGAVLFSAFAFAPDGDKINAYGPPAKFIDPANMDLSVKPGDDFFEYAKNWPLVKTLPTWAG
jgi:putative endopeptidase